jgi:hypothetical protein
MNYPILRGIEDVATNIGAIRNPNTKGICRGIKKPGEIAEVSSSITLKFKTSAPHIGKCEVYILDENLGNARKIASKDGCIAPGKVRPWRIRISSGITGRNVLHWTWNAAHFITTIEYYEQCADINIGGDSSKDDSSSTETDDTTIDNTSANATTTADSSIYDRSTDDSQEEGSKRGKGKGNKGESRDNSTEDNGNDDSADD